MNFGIRLNYRVHLRAKGVTYLDLYIKTGKGINGGREVSCLSQQRADGIKVIPLARY